jgi:hypothetical protein
MEYLIFWAFCGVIIGIPVVVFAKMRKSHEGKAKRLVITLAVHFEVNGKDEKYHEYLNKLRKTLKGLPNEQLSTLSDIKSFYDKKSKKEITGSAITLLSSTAMYVLLDRHLNKSNDNNIPPFILPL